ncbi:EpsG family protein [uncultured Photobacterium sp.]|uniref:EpsG family protein n=1 Tax=uncultured Photobacterium sp. TaxID=173973 RepID=UPI00262DA7B4|nr:EpsG family protein [uncultured Photobacterium sp.]
MIYYIIFSILALFSFTDVWQDKRYSKLAFIVSFFILFLFGSLRLDTGWDFATYRFYFNKVDTISIFLTNGFSPLVYFDLGFKFLISIIKSIGLGFQTLIFICNLFVIYCVYSFINRHIEYKNSAILLFYSLCYLFINFSILRQGIAAGLVLLAIDSYFNKRNLKVLIYLLTATLFHFSAIIFLPLIFLSTIIKIKKGFFITILLIITIFAISHISIFEVFYNIFHSFLPQGLNQKIEFYINSTRFGASRTIGFGFIEKLFFLSIMFHYLFIQKNNNRSLNLIALLLLSYFAIYILFIDIQAIYTRLKFYFMVIASCYYPLFIYNILNRKNSRSLGVIICILFSFINLYNTLRFEANAVVFMPYQSVLTELPSYLNLDYYRIDRAQEIIQNNQK